MMITFTVNVLKLISIKFAFLCFKSGRVSFEIHLIASCYFSIMFKFVKAVKFWYFDPCMQYVNVKCSHFQQFLHCGIPRFIFVPLIMAM